ncbi:unnamed protein product [Symbiodinium natans]|uniref:CUB domain-containing protein n=1 Tax=Symbiodinium natans TaxID=878477 RepID=A0A812U5N8_9DINO|nr:unnamed protein product [Symbiodinium natans]
MAARCSTLCLLGLASLVEGTPSWQVTSGSCVVEGDCVASSNYPTTYPDNDRCVIEVVPNNTRAIDVINFLTEESFDSLIINGLAYSGSNGPQGVVPQEALQWISDAGHFLDLLTNLSAPLDGSFAGKRSCTAEGDCIASSNYPGNYPDNASRDACQIAVDPNNTRAIRVESFSTEQDFDLLTVNGAEFSGMNGPSGVTPQGTILWGADARLHPLALWVHRARLVEFVSTFHNHISMAPRITQDLDFQDSGF